MNSLFPRRALSIGVLVGSVIALSACESSSSGAGYNYYDNYYPYRSSIYVHHRRDVTRPAHPPARPRPLPARPRAR